MEFMPRNNDSLAPLFHFWHVSLINWGYVNILSQEDVSGVRRSYLVVPGGGSCFAGDEVKISHMQGTCSTSGIMVKSSGVVWSLIATPRS